MPTDEGRDHAPAEELAELRRVLREKDALVSSFPDVYFRMDADGRILDYRNNAPTALYVQPEHFLGKVVWELLPDDCARVNRHAHERALRTGELVRVEYDLPVPGADGSRVGRYEARYLALSTDEASVFIRDITAMREAQRELERTISVLRATLDATADGILVVDLAGNIVGYNEKFRRLFSLPEDVLARRSSEVALAFVLRLLTDPEGFVSRVRALYRDREAEAFDEIRFLDGRVLERYSQPQRQGGVVVGRVWSFRDVTERVKADEERARLLAETREALRSRDEFISIASHELRTPLTSLQLAVQSLQRLAERGAEALRQAPLPALRSSLSVALRQTRVMTRLVEELLSMARIEAGHLELVRRRCDLGEVVREVVDDLAEEAQQAGCEVKVEVEGTVAGAWDRAKLVQLSTNLLSNALRYGAGRPVRVRLRAEAGAAVLVVEDEGIGVEAEAKDRIFDAFARAVPASHYGGLGLGLYIVRSIVLAHGGSVSLESEPNQGARFTVQLPLDG